MSASQCTHDTLRKARRAAQDLKLFVQENRDIEAMCPHLRSIEMVMDLEAMTGSARTQQPTMHHFFSAHGCR